MPNTFKLDARDFNNTLQKYVEWKQKDFVTEANRRSANIIMKAMQYTKRTSPLKIEAELNAQAQSFRSPRQLKTNTDSKRKKFKPFYKGAPVGFKIFNWRRKNRPQSLRPKLRGKGLAGKAMGAQFDLFVKATKSSCNYIVSGWMPALNKFKLYARGGVKASKGLRTPSPQTSAGKGFGTPAFSKGDYIKTNFSNAANGIDKIGQAPLRLAFRLEELDMRSYMEKEHQKELNKLRG